MLRTILPLCLRWAWKSCYMLAWIIPPVQALGAQPAESQLWMCSWPWDLALTQQTREGVSGWDSSQPLDIQYTFIQASTFCTVLPYVHVRMHRCIWLYSIEKYTILDTQMLTNVMRLVYEQTYYINNIANTGKVVFMPVLISRAACFSNTDFKFGFLYSLSHH